MKINSQQIKEMKKKEEKEAIVNLKNEQRKKTTIIFNNDSNRMRNQNSSPFTKTFNNVDLKNK